MNDYAPWLQANDQYLAAALADLRARLQRAAQSPDAPATPPAPAAAATALMESAPAVRAPNGPKQSWFARVFATQPARASLASVQVDTIDTPPAIAPVVVEVPDPGAAAAAASPPHDADDGKYTPALAMLADRLGLSAFERELLLLCIGMELDTRFPALCAQAQHDPSRPYPTFALAFAVLDAPS